MNRRSFIGMLHAPLLTALVPVSAQTTLYSQSLQAVLSREYPHLDLLLFGTRKREQLVNTFADALLPISVGSLLKPFLAYAYLNQASPPPLAVSCRGHSDRCWKAGGHGSLSLPQALAQSCNAFFLALARNLPQDLIRLPGTPPAASTPEDLIGLTARWQIAPEVLLNGYRQLLNARPGPVIAGMSLAAATGTASLIGPHPGGVLAKTGTAPCLSLSAPCQASGDGLIFAALPAADPAILLLVRQQATTGAVAAGSAGSILTRLRTLRAF